MELKIDRDVKMLDVYTVRAKMEVLAALEQNFGDVQYVRLINFMNDKTDTSLRKTILANPYAKAFILDLRGNPGGGSATMVSPVVENPTIQLTPRVQEFKPTVPFYKRLQELEELKRRQR